MKRVVRVLISPSLLLAAALAWAADEGPRASTDATETADQAETAADKEQAILNALQRLPNEDRRRAEAQRFCPITSGRLGSRGVPPRLALADGASFVCCTACEAPAQAAAQTTLKRVEKLKKISAATARLAAVDRPDAESQWFCAVKTKNELGAMGVPIKFSVGDEAVYLCCSACERSAKADPRAALVSAEKLKAERRKPRPAK